MGKGIYTVWFWAVSERAKVFEIETPPIGKVFCRTRAERSCILAALPSKDSGLF